jgi:NAD(P)-dependent dehydrogenase (short-subunit alcohol dehydrogenase family)
MYEDIKDSVVIITGASRGLGFEIASNFYQHGARVIVSSRNKDELDHAAKKIIQLDSSHKRNILTFQSDVSSKKDCNDLVSFTLDQFGKVTTLINNAGVYGPKGRFSELSETEFDQAMKINFYGSMYMIQACIKHFLEANLGCVIQLSGGGATKALKNISGYSVSKTAIIRLIENLAADYSDTNLKFNSIAPGALNTSMLDEIIDAGPDKVGLEFYNQSLKQYKDGGSDPKIAASLCLFLASRASDGINGRMISAIWDKWESFPENLSLFQGDDSLFRLSRILPKSNLEKEKLIK